jgi:hypothetical protein
MSERDTRPDWMLDPSMTEIDHDAIAAVGKELEQHNQDAMNSSFITRVEDSNLAGMGQGSQSPAPASTDPSSDAPPPADGAPSTEPPASSAGENGGGEAPTPAQAITVALPDGSEVELSRDQVFGLMQNYEWMRSRPQAVLEAWGGIENGTHQAIPQTEYAQFQAWKAQQGLAQRVGQRPVDLDDLDPDVARYIAKLEQAQTDTPPSMAPAPGQGAPLAPVSAMDLAAQQQAQVARQVGLMAAKQEVHADLMARYNLTAEQVNALEQEVVAAQIVPGISMKHAVKNAMGQVIQEGNPKAVFNEAFEAVMATHPTFRAIRDDAVYQQRVQQERTRNATTDAKKAAAGSLAHTPSAAVSATGQGNKNPAQMSPQELQQAMIAELTQLMASGEAAR